MSPQRAKDLPLRWVRCPRLGPPPPLRENSPGPEPARLHTAHPCPFSCLPSSIFLASRNLLEPRPSPPPAHRPIACPPAAYLGPGRIPPLSLLRTSPASLPAQASLHTRVCADAPERQQR